MSSGALHCRRFPLVGPRPVPRVAACSCGRGARGESSWLVLMLVCMPFLLLCTAPESHSYRACRCLGLFLCFISRVWPRSPLVISLSRSPLAISLSLSLSLSRSLFLFLSLSLFLSFSLSPLLFSISRVHQYYSFLVCSTGDLVAAGQASWSALLYGRRQYIVASPMLSKAFINGPPGAPTRLHHLAVLPSLCPAGSGCLKG